MFHIIKSYLKYLWNSKNQHGVHSPFVFSLVTKCFYNKETKPDYLISKNYRQKLLDNKNTIEIIDFGAGSRVFKSNKRTILKIANTAGISQKRGELLYRVVQYFHAGNILEIGTSLGLATSALSTATKKGKVTTLEGCANTARIAQEQFKDFGFKNVKLIVGEFQDHLEKISPEKFDLIYYDGNHQKEATLKYFELLIPTVTNDSVWIFDDIHWSKEMEQSWEIIKKNPNVTLTIDTFQWGFVFFRHEGQKEHFVIRV